MAIDGRNLQILANYCAAAADAMAFTLMRTAHSTFVKETEDFSCQIVSRDGLAFASPRSFGAPWYSGIDYGPVLALIDHYDEGDICITNDSYAGNVATHSPDIHIWKPVFHQGEIVCFVVGHIHNTDVGGAVPASLSRSLTDIVQEGIRIPPLKIVRNGELNEEVARIMRLNVRVPDQNWGDFKAQLASVNVGERKIHEIIARFGVVDFLQGIDGMLEYAERQARSIIATIPDGEYFYADFADEDGEGGFPCRVAITLRVQGETLELDYTGSDPQLASSLNMPTGGRERHPLALVGVTYVLSTLDRNLLLNAGTLRPTRAILPPGTVMNCEAPAAVGMRSLTCALSQIATIGVFSQAIPDRLPANSPGGNSIMNIRTSDAANRSVVASLGPVGGGAGGTPRHDGPDGSGGLSAFLKNTPIEINEAEVPIHFHRYGLVPDSAGAGRYRGGLASEMVFEVFAPDTLVTARNRNRSVFASAGVLGGAPGALSHFRTLRDGDTLEHGNTDVIRCQPGDVVEVCGPGAGGYGLAVDRDVQAVLRDVRCGFVSLAAAREQYGVAIVNDQVDEVMTAELRHAMRQPAAGHFDHGAARDAFEAVWTPQRYQLLTAFLAAAPVGWRHFLKHQVFKAVAADSQPETGMAAQMHAIFSQLRQRYPAMMV
ncbi:hydantoinase B/oxoprolinase family protein [Pantoea cypripedii]|uniref:Hydantoin utilization protein B n=1 Tax=Pantoea cypripedii TaxID=55209 RepID=A0A1X1EVU5_PANCY|nr:hydantoinase B/oxoprolinase family protein [Pantoea cypripedii]MBP2198218.1 N-methylhydantoinase B [Pantoea cypripedii]ORM94051.1 hydantoin utilization protein B [Pantoea cypripedii]